MNRKYKVAPSLLACDFGHLADEIDMINGTSADWFHVDVMDGQFVPNISFGQDIVRTIKKHAEKPLDVHLMIERPEYYIDDFREAGADHITVHVEASKHIHSLIAQIKATGAKAGIALNPHTSLSSIEEVLEDLDIVLIMSVNPGFGGQKFIYNTIPKLKSLKIMLEERNLDPYIIVDGGVGLHNAQAIIEAGGNVLVAGNAVFRAQDPKAAVDQFKKIADNFVL